MYVLLLVLGILFAILLLSPGLSQYSDDTVYDGDGVDVGAFFGGDGGDCD
jgi:hypothetical protein